MPDLFDDIGFPAPAPRVLMSLHAEYYELIMAGQKVFEYRKRYATDAPSTWIVYLNAPVSRLTAVIDLGEPITGSPAEIAAIAEHARPGNGEPVRSYLEPAGRGVALPIQRVREYSGFTADDLAAALGKWHPPQGYILVDRNPALAALCDELAAGAIVRELQLQPHASAVP
ncbi:ASCH domain-containing protein [Nocardia asiatica]|uniref:ASCH domain-containing protein n=1 Tax=Nocardia asiatica TaxID=209252 RepID=UPI0002D3AEF2|nr:ASCH domain-containing protein [Nocardia asiatica]